VLSLAVVVAVVVSTRGWDEKKTGGVSWVLTLSAIACPPRHCHGHCGCCCGGGGWMWMDGSANCLFGLFVW
jgi:hypothetical protein